MRQIGRLMVVILFVGALIAGGAPAAFAQQPSIAAPEQGFVPVKNLPAQQEQLPAAPLVMTAYAVAWVVLVLYLWSIWRRLAGVEREMAAVGRRLEPGGRR
jgi:CcmD family protein